MQDNPLFLTAAEFVNSTSKHIFLTGKAGTGKTTFLKYIKENTPKKCVVVAPTGVASINAGGVTMHSFFQLPLGPFVPVTSKYAGGDFTDQYTLFKNIRISEQKRALFRDLELLVIDEVSMVRCDMLDAVDSILRYFRNALHIPFGGVQVLYIGDLYQLPPVMPETQWSILREYYASPFFFHSRVVEQAPMVYIELKKIYRQSQQSFIDILNRIRNDETTGQDLEILNARRQALPQPGQHYITLTTHNYKADKINADELKKLKGKLYEFRGAVEGDFPDSTLPTEMVLQLKEGAQIMFIRNDKSEERRYYNGKLATVKKIDSESIRVVLSDSKEELVLEKETWSNIRYSYNQEHARIDEEKLGSFTQYPVRLAWAITIHKSQGLTFKHAIIDAGESFAAGQVYVALSRCTSLDGLILHSKILPGSISTDPRVLAFSKKEAEADELSRVLQEEKLIFQNAQLAKTFDLETLIKIFHDFPEYPRGKKLPNTGEALSKGRKMLTIVEEQQKVALKFQQQIHTLLRDDQPEKLRERVVKGIDYFSRVLTDQLLFILDQHIANLKGASKVRKYLKRVRQIRLEVVRKINAINEVQFGAVIFNPSVVKLSITPEIIPAKSKKAERGSSLNETLTMFKSGLNLSEIAARRNFAVSTIEGHIALLIKSGNVAIQECMEETKLTTILEVIRNNKEPSMQPLKQKLGDAVSYGDIRAVINYLHFLEKQVV